MQIIHLQIVPKIMLQKYAQFSFQKVLVLRKKKDTIPI
jgi:hypothetical protein